MLYSTYLMLALVSVLLIGCAERTDTELSVSANGSGEMLLHPPPLLINSRMIDRELLFAEVSISYSDVSNDISNPVTVERDANTGLWRTELRVPTQTAFTITVTWFDRVDQQRLDLSTTTDSFQPINFPGDLLISTNLLNFDSDNFDADLDSIVNLTERLDGTSPFDASSPSNDDPTSLPTPSTATPPDGIVEVKIGSNTSTYFAGSLPGAVGSLALDQLPASGDG